MKTLFQAEEIGNELVLLYLNDWPKIIDGKVVYNGLRLLDYEEGSVGEIEEDGTVRQLSTEIRRLPLSSEFKETLLKKQNWRQVDTETGQQLLLPPNLEAL